MKRERIRKDREGVMGTESTNRGTNGGKSNEVNWKREEGEKERIMEDTNLYRWMDRWGVDRYEYETVNE